jgi:hypothetical protein
LCGNVVDLGEVACLVVAEKKPFVEARDGTVIHCSLVLFLKARRQTKQPASLCWHNLIEIADVADASDDHILSLRHRRGQAVPIDYEGIPVAVLQSKVVLHGFLQLHFLKACLGYP